MAATGPGPPNCVTHMNVECVRRKHEALSHRDIESPMRWYLRTAPRGWARARRWNWPCPVSLNLLPVFVHDPDWLTGPGRGCRSPPRCRTRPRRCSWGRRWRWTCHRTTRRQWRSCRHRRNYWCRSSRWNWSHAHCSIRPPVSDRSDGKIAHLDGLNLSRAWCWRLLSSAVGARRSSSCDRVGGRRPARGGELAARRRGLCGRTLALRRMRCSRTSLLRRVTPPSHPEGAEATKRSVSSQGS